MENSIDYELMIRTPGKTRLYRGPDHLLLVEAKVFEEHYRRFYFKEIQALIIRRTDERIYSVLILMTVAVFIFALARITGDVFLSRVLIGMGAFFSGLIALALAMGPRCVCHIRTAAQVAELKWPRHERKAQKLFATIRELVQEAQAGESISTELHDHVLRHQDAAHFTAQTEPTPILSGLLHLLLSGFVLADAFAIAMVFVISTPMFALMNVLTFMLMSGVIVITLAMQQNARISHTLRRWAWAVFGYAIFRAIGLIVQYGVALLRSMDEAAGVDDDFFTYLVSLNPVDIPFIETLYISMGFVGFFLACYGVVLKARYKVEGVRQ